MLLENIDLSSTEDDYKVDKDRNPANYFIFNTIFILRKQTLKKVKITVPGTKLSTTSLYVSKI